MSSNEILDDFSDRQKPRLTPFQRAVRITSFLTWVAFLAALLFKLESFPGASTVMSIAMIVLAVLYLFLPIPLFRSTGWNQHLAAHWVGAMMLSFFLGLFLKLESLPHGSTMYYVAGFGSIAGLIALLFLLIKKDWNRDERRFWLSMVIRLALVLLLTSGTIIRLIFHPVR